MCIAKTVVTIAIATLGVTGCSAGVEGTYKFDHAETAKAMAADLDKSAKGLPMPPGLAMLSVMGLDRLEWTIELQGGGQLNMTMAVSRPKKTDVVHGTWTRDGDSIVLTGDGKGLPQAGSTAIKCATSSARLRCDIGNDHGVALIFLKS